MHQFLVVLLSTFLVQGFGQVRAQLQSCRDLGVPVTGSVCTCRLNNTILDPIGVSNFTTELSVDPLSWLVGFVPHEPAEGTTVLPDHRAFFLQQPPFVDLRQNSSVQACAIFFNGVAPKLKFSNTESKEQIYVSKGTCEDAMTAQCVSDWKQQANDLINGIEDSVFSCQKLADEIQSNPPSSCSMVKKTWGEVVAKKISAQGLQPSITNTSFCNMIPYQNHSLTEVLRINGTEDDMLYGITPILTTFKPNSADGELKAQVNLNCVKPVADAVDGNTRGIVNSSIQLQLRITSVLLVIFSIVLQVVI